MVVLVCFGGSWGVWGYSNSVLMHFDAFWDSFLTSPCSPSGCFKDVSGFS